MQGSQLRTILATQLGDTHTKQYLTSSVVVVAVLRLPVYAILYAMQSGDCLLTLDNTMRTMRWIIRDRFFECLGLRLGMQSDDVSACTGTVRSSQ
jgi:hypothetical protein